MDWEKAEKHMKEALKDYFDLIGMPNVMPFFALQQFHTLLIRFNQGERTQELYDSMMSCE